MAEEKTLAMKIDEYERYGEEYEVDVNKILEDVKQHINSALKKLQSLFPKEPKTINKVFKEEFGELVK